MKTNIDFFWKVVEKERSESDALKEQVEEVKTKVNDFAKVISELRKTEKLVKTILENAENMDGLNQELEKLK